MKKLSLQLLSETVVAKRKTLNLTQTQVAEKANMNRSMLSKLKRRSIPHPSNSCRPLQKY